MASTIQTPVAQAVLDLFTGNLGLLADKGLRKERGRNYGYSVSSLFANGEQGVWYDPSDLTTMFQDAAGTTPVTAVEQPVGLILDKSKGLVLGAELVVNGWFDSDTYWTKNAGVTIAGGVCDFAAVGEGTGVSKASVLTIGKVYQVTYTIVSRSAGSVRLWTSGISRSAAGTYTEYYVATSTSFGMLVTIGGGTFTGTIDNISVRELPGNHASQTTATKRPILKLIAGKYSLLFDGIDDALVTGSIDFTATDKMTVVAGVRKLSDANFGMLAELSANSTIVAGNGGFLLIAGRTPEKSTFGSRGTISAEVYGDATYAAPITEVICGSSSISAPSVVLRENAVQKSSSAATQGTGNYGNYPLYIGSRAGTSLPFNGHLYSFIVRGAQSTDAQITSAETWVNGKTGAY